MDFLEPAPAPTEPVLDAILDAVPDTVEEKTLRSLLDGDDDRPAVRITDGHAYSRQTLRREVASVAQQLARLGIKRGAVVSLSFDNDIELIICFIAVTWLGATAAPLNAAYLAHEVEFYLTDLSSDLLLLPQKGNAQAEQAALKCNVPTATALSRLASVHIEPGHLCKPTTMAVIETRAQPEDVALFLHTSGTTGLPKGVPLSHRNMLVTMANVARTYRLAPEDVGYLVMPLFHVHGLMAALFAPLFAGGSVVLPGGSAGFQASLLWTHVSTYKCSWFTAVPTMHQALLANSDLFVQAGSPSLRFIRSCSSSLPPPVLAKLEQAFHAPVIEAYAMTEACHQMTSNPLPEDGPHKAGSVGKAFNVELLILDAEGVELANGEIGEVCVRGANITRGYHNRPKANEESFLENGFFRTGDLGYLDEEGYVFLTGRIKEQINRGGEKIAPVAIDNILLSCPGIAALFAFGAPHAELGEVVAVVVVVKKGETVSLKQLNSFGLRSKKLAAHWLPFAIVYCDAIPKGPTGKVQRTKLASMLGLPAFSLEDSPASFRYTPDCPLERLDQTSGVSASTAEATTVDSPVSVTEKISYESLVEFLGDVVGFDVSEEDTVIDSFTAVKVSNMVSGKYGVVLPISDCIILRPRHVHALITSASSIGSTRTSAAAVKPEPSTAEDFELEAALPADVQVALTTAAAGLANGPTDPTLSASRGAVLLTGATGFIGSHILAALLANPSVTRVICLVRAAAKEECEVRVRDKCLEQGLDWQADRVSTLLGDTSEPMWGLTPEDLGALETAGVAAVLHNSAYVNHALQFRGLAPHNVGSVHSAIKLAAHLTAASGAPCHCAFVSTGGVCGRLSFADAEEPLRLPASSLASQNGYVQCKWVAERAMENAASFLAGTCLRLGLPVEAVSAPRFSVFRPGAVTGHTVTGACNIGDSINRYLIGFSLLGAAPPLDPQSKVDTSPVDWNAGAIAGITLQHCGLSSPPAEAGSLVQGKLVPVYTLDNGLSLTYAELLVALEHLGRPIRVTDSYEDWLALLTSALLKEDQDGATVLNPLRSLKGALLSKPPKFGSTCCAKHMSLLASLGYPCPSIDAGYLSVCLNRFVELGALPAVSGGTAAEGADE